MSGIMLDNEVATRQATPRLRFVAIFPFGGVSRDEDQGADWVVMRVRAGIELEPAHFDVSARGTVV
jgi:hypothetical protein